MKNTSGDLDSLVRLDGEILLLVASLLTAQVPLNA